MTNSPENTPPIAAPAAPHEGISPGRDRPFLRRVREAEDSLQDIADAGHVREMAAVFKDMNDLRHAVDELVVNGFAPTTLTILASEEHVAQKLGHRYRRIEEAAADPSAPRVPFVPDENIGQAMGAAIGVPLYLSAITATGIAAASGGTVLMLGLSAAAAGTAGMALGASLARKISNHQAEYIKEQIDLGGFLLWINLERAETEDKAREILERHKSSGIKVHNIAI